MYIKRKYQVGGVVYTPYLPAQAGSPQESTSTSGGTTSSGSSPEKISGTIKKEIIDLLKANGMPSDVSTLIDTANGFLLKSRALSNYSIFGGEDEDYDLSDLMKVQQLVNDVKYNNDLRDKAVQQMTSEAAGSEVAVTSTGLMYAFNKDGQIERIKPTEYDPEKYRALTNDELLYYREHDNGLAFDTGILNDLQNTIGMKAITDYLRTSIKAFGTDELGGYTTKNDSVNRGLALLNEAGPDGYYKFKTQDQLRDVNAAINFLYEGMTPNARNLLVAKTAAEGGDPKNQEDVTRLILQALYHYPSYSKTVDFDKTATDFDPYTTGKKGGSSTGSEQLTQNTYQIRFGNGEGLPVQVLLTPTAAKINDTATMAVQGTDFGPMEDWDNKQLGQMNMPKLLKEWALGTSVRNADITFGNKLLDYSELPAIMYDGQSLTTSVYLPYKDENGHYTPDFELFARFNEFNNVARGLSPVERNTLAQKFGLDANTMVYNPETGGYTLKNTMRFVTFSAYAGDDTIKFDANNKLYLEKVTRSKGSTLKDPYNKALKYNDIYADEKKGIVVNKGFEKATANDFWRGNVFIAAPDAFYGYNSSSNEYIPKDMLSRIDRRVQANNMIVDAVDHVRNNDPDYYSKSKIGQFKDE